MSRFITGRKTRSNEGNTLPLAQAISSATVAETIANALNNTWGHLRHSAKLLASSANTNVRTVRNWLDGANAPNSAELIKLMAIDDNVFRAVLDLAGRSDRRPVELTEEQRRTLSTALRILEGGTDGDDLDRVHEMAGPRN
jgi:hypothetical protein